MKIFHIKRLSPNGLTCAVFLVRQTDVFRTSERQILPLQDQQLTTMLAKRFFERCTTKPSTPRSISCNNWVAPLHHSILFFPSNHFRRSATPMLYAFPSFAAGSSLECKAFRICLSFVPMRMAASLTVTAIRSSNGDLEDTIHLSFLILATNILYRPLAITARRAEQPRLLLSVLSRSPEESSAFY